MGDVLAVKLDHIGDFALAVPTLHAIAQRIAPAKLDVFCAPWNEGWREALPWVRHFFTAPVSYRPRFSGWLKVHQISQLAALLWASRKLRGSRYDVAINLRTFLNDWPGAIPAFLSGAPSRIGSGGTGERLLTVVDRGSEGHESDRIFNRAKRAFVLEKMEIEGLTNVSRKRADARPRLLLHPGASCEAKRWPQDYWLQLLRSLRSEGDWELQLMGGPGDKSLLQSLASQAGMPDMKMSLSQSIVDALQQMADADLMVALDSGPAHMAALVGTPRLTIFSGLNDPRRWRALGENELFTSAEDCVECKLSKGPFVEHSCMRMILPSQVLSSIRSSGPDLKLRNLL